MLNDVQLTPLQRRFAANVFAVLGNTSNVSNDNDNDYKQEAFEYATAWFPWQARLRAAL